MSFRLDLVNRAGLFRNYAEWHEADKNWADLSHINMAHGLSSIVYALERIHLLKKECLDQYTLFDDKYRWPQPEILFRSPSMFDLFASYSAYLLSIRLAQNSILNILGKKLGLSIPQSMNGIAEWKRKNKIPKRTLDLIILYWEQSGFEIKQYRDLDQHYGLVARDAWIVRSSQGVDLKVYLPDDPAIQSESKFTFTLKRDAFDYADKSFELFHSFVNELSASLGYTSERDFDYNMSLPINYGVSVHITSDPYQKKLCATELNVSTKEFEIHESLERFDSYTYIKINKHFPIKHSFLKETPQSGKTVSLD
ncbi:hypothetical protein [Pseudomonas sp. DR 5-09]|uniref:hypothetical protein n=1 Tax=Pseudomonas sp. DR 5-09 TaxID=1534110 RepID=UPI0007E41A69|nr:hypothetical protein [Pseudomonas sp. DR 5-09]